MANLLDGLKELYQGEDILYKHLSFACIAGLVSLLSDSDFLKGLFTKGDFLAGIACIIAAIAGSLYMFGYLIEVVHFRLNTGVAIMPELDTKPFGRVLAVLPLMLLWGFFFIIAGLVMVIPMILGLLPITIIAFIAYIIFAAFVPFVFIAYAKDFQTMGLTNITLPFKFMSLAFGDLVITGLKFMLLYFILVLPATIIGVIIVMINNTVGFAVAISLIGYISFIMNILWYNALCEIYIDKIYPEMEELY